jgi:hypothetical protein
MRNLMPSRHLMTLPTIALAPAATACAAGPLPGMPPLLDPNDVYDADRPNQLSQVVSHSPTRVYVPNSGSDTVDIIDSKTFKIVRRSILGPEESVGAQRSWRQHHAHRPCHEREGPHHPTTRGSAELSAASGGAERQPRLMTFASGRRCCR